MRPRQAARRVGNAEIAIFGVSAQAIGFEILVAVVADGYALLWKNAPWAGLRGRDFLCAVFFAAARELAFFDFLVAIATLPMLPRFEASTRNASRGGLKQLVRRGSPLDRMFGRRRLTSEGDEALKVSAGGTRRRWRAVRPA